MRVGVVIMDVVRDCVITTAATIDQRGKVPHGPDVYRDHRMNAVRSLQEKCRLKWSQSLMYAEN